MKVKLMGAARTVTGSCYIFETEGTRFAVDCGLHQGGAANEKRNWDIDLYQPGTIDFVIITHAHIDHSGLLPRLVAHGFRGPVYATAPTLDLLRIMLLDSAHIQEMEAQWKSKKRLRYGGVAVAALYTKDDVEKTYALFKEINYDKPWQPIPGVQAVLRDAGHILGAAFLELNVREGGMETKVVISGDLGRPAQLLVNDPTHVEQADYLFLESTYGQRNHKNEDDSLDELAEAVAYSYERGEKMIVPAFAVARTQEIIYSLYLLSKQGRLPSDMPIFVDSPLAIKATQLFRKYQGYLDGETKAILGQGEDPLALPQLKFTEKTEESVKINEYRGSAIVISASGMADAGRIKHHLRHNLWRPGASIVFVGFQAGGSVGRKIIDGVKKINILGEEVAVKARIFTIGGFSGHAGQDQLLGWLGHFRSPGMQVILVHGEYGAQQNLAALVEARFGLSVHIPEYLEEITIKRGFAIEAVRESVFEPVDWDNLMGEIAAGHLRLKEQQNVLAARPPKEQIVLRDLLLEAKARLNEVMERI